MIENLHNKSHWEAVYATKATDSVSWFQAEAAMSLRLIAASGVRPDVAVIDVGGGASTLVDDLLARGFSHLSVLDLSGAALAAARQRLGALADQVRWIEADITQVALPVQALWHDRAVFHFLTAATERAAYRHILLNTLLPNGHVILATFAEDGPTQCSGLPVQRYSAASLAAEFSANFTLLSSHQESHLTPNGKAQSFVFVHLQRND